VVLTSGAFLVFLFLLKINVDSKNRRVDSKSTKVDSKLAKVDSKTKKVDSIFVKVDSKCHRGVCAWAPFSC